MAKEAQETAVATAEATTTAQEVETKASETTQAEVKETATTESTDDLDGIEIVETESGKEYVFKTDPDDPKSSVYKGKTKGELMKNIRNGVKEKDTYIGKLKANDVKVPDNFKNRKPEEISDDVPVEAPDEDAIYRKHLDSELKRSGLKPEMLQWTDAEWDTYAADNSLRDWKVTELRQSVRETRANVRQRAEREISEQNVIYINNTVLDQETEGVRELIAESGLSPEEFDYEKVLQACNDKHRNKQGVFISGRIVTEAAKEINRILKSKGESKLKAKLVEDIAKGEEEKTKVKSPSGSGSPRKPTTKSPGNYDDAFSEAAAMLRK